MQTPCPIELVRRDRRRPNESAMKSKKIQHEITLTMPYTPVLNKDVDSPVMPRFLKICGAYAGRC